MLNDLKFSQNANGKFDFSLTSTGDLEADDSFGSMLAYAIFGERRASPSEVGISKNRRGWIGNEGKDFENGSKIWLFEQERLTRTILNDIQGAALDAVQYLVDDGFAINVIAEVTIENRQPILTVEIFVSESKVETFYFEIWNNTGS